MKSELNEFNQHEKGLFMDRKLSADEYDEREPEADEEEDEDIELEDEEADEEADDADVKEDEDGADD
jgi:hypothetical protein